MKSRSLIPILGAVFLVGGITSAPAAKTAGSCLECHSQNLVRNGSANFYASADIENRNVYQTRMNPCPGVRTLAEETYYTESRLVTVNRMAGSLDREGTAVHTWRLKVAETWEAFSHMKKAEASPSQFAKGSAVLRAGLQKTYAQAFQVRTEADHRWLIGLGGIIFVALLVLIGIGYGKLKEIGKSVFLISLLAGSFSLSACSQKELDSKAKSPAQERLDQAQGVTAKLSARAEDSFSSAVLLAGLARDWARIDPGNADKAFHLSWKMAVIGREAGNQMVPLQRVTEEWPNPMEAAKQKVNYAAVLDLRDELKAMEGRTWALRAIAEEWYKANPGKGREALESITSEALAMARGEIRDIELKALAEAWSGIDEKRALEAANSIEGSFLRSMGLATVAKSLKEKERAEELWQESWKLAETVSPSALKIYAFSKISAGAAETLPQKKGQWAKRVQAQIGSIKDPGLLIYGYRELISSWASADWEQAERWVDEIPMREAEGKAFSLIRIGRSAGIPKERAVAVFKKALAEADRIEEPFLAQKARTLILCNLASLDPREAAKGLPKIEDPILRSEVETELLVGQVGLHDAERAIEIAGNIPNPFERWKTILKILSRKLPSEVDRLSALHQGTMQAALAVSDPYPGVYFMIELGKSWGRIDKRRESEAYDLALKSCGQISSPSLRAEALEALANVWKISNKARAQSIMEKLDENVLQARKGVEDVRLWSKTDPEKAEKIAGTIPLNLVLEKAQAHYEIAFAIKISHPKRAADELEKSWQLLASLPEGGTRDRKLSLILKELTPLNLDKSLELVQTLSDRWARDILLQEAGNSLLKEDVPKAIRGALKIAKEVSESSLRTSLYQKIADLAGRGIKGSPTNEPILAALALWGKGKESSRTEEAKAGPYFEKAFREIGKIPDARERNFILAGILGDWCQIDETKAREAAETISPEFPEPLSFGLMQVCIQLRKWSRKEAEAGFQKAVTAAVLIRDPSLRAQRFVQIAGQWRAINKEKGSEILKIADGLAVNPENRTRALLDSAKEIYKEAIEKDLKLLEKALQFAQGNKNPWILTEIALAWSRIDAAKAREVWALIDSEEMRIGALRAMARQGANKDPERSREFLEKAVREAEAMDGLREKILALRGIAEDWAGLDPGQAKNTYRLALQAAERADQIRPRF